MSCIRPNGQLHLQLRTEGEIIFVPLGLVRVQPSPMDVRLLPLTPEFVSFAVKLLTTVTEEMEKADGFDEDLLRDQLIKALQLKAARAILSHPDCLRVALASPLVRQLRDPVSDLRKMPTPSSPPSSLPAYPRVPSSGMVRGHLLTTFYGF